MQWNEEYLSTIFSENTKRDIFKKNSEEIETKFEWVKKFPAEERSGLIFGAVFETLAVSENLENHPENDIQKKMRSLIQVLYQKAEITLGEKWPSKPDFVSVVFDKDGHLVIDEILEMKTSVIALEHGINKKQSQPQNSIQTIERIVDLTNIMINAPDVLQIKEINKLQGKYDKYRKNFLKDTFLRIKELGLSENITFSQDLQYHVVLPTGETGNIPKLEVTHDNKPIRVAITNSRFSKKDIHNIIDHYQETP